MNVQREFSDGQVVPGTRYRVIALIGSGGMGSVYEVEHEELGKRFVLKALLRSLASREDLQHRLRNEWRALGRLEHPSIVSVTDAGMSTTGVPFYVMERLRGETLAARLRRDRRVPMAEAVRIAADVCEGLGAAHRIEIVHRDIKPPNVFLATGRPATVLDFGVAKILDPNASQITGKGVAVGTPRYMAPEQALGGMVDARTDLYAVGLTLFECIAGVGPFDSSPDPNEVFLAQVSREAPLLSSAAPGVPRDLDVLTAKLLAKAATDRPGDAGAVAAELRAIEKRLVAASPAPAPSRGRPEAVPPSEQPTRTGLGPVPDGTAAGVPPPLTGASVSADGHPDTVADRGPPVSGHGESQHGASPQQQKEQKGSTLRLSEPPRLRVYGDDVATRTSAPAALQETPPPIEHPQTPPGRPAAKARWGSFALAALVAAAAAGVLATGRTAPPASPGSPPGQSAAAPSTAKREAARTPDAPAAAVASAPHPHAAPAPLRSAARAVPAPVPTPARPPASSAPHQPHPGPLPAPVRARPASLPASGL